MRRHPILLVPALLMVSLFFAGCRNDADDFFSGRPSEMAMVHNRIIGGPPESMVILLQVPSRFPEATESHISHWQDSVIAWWRNAEKHELLVDSLRKISPNEVYTLRVWLRVRGKYQTKENALTLAEIEAALDAVPSSR